MRVSTKEQAESNHSLAGQERATRALAEREGWEVAEVFCGAGESAYAGARTQWRAMLAAVRRRRAHFGAVIVYDLSRFSRNAEHQAVAINELRRLGVVVRSVCEANVDDSPAGNLLAGMVAVLNEFHSSQKSANTREAIAHSLESGRWPHQPPAGYCPSRTPGVPEIERVQGGLMRELFTRVADGESVASAHRALKARAFRPSHTRAHQLLRSPFYVARTVLEDGRIVAGRWPALVTADVFDRVQRRLAKPDTGDQAAPGRTYRKLDERFPWRGTLVCEGCGRALTGDGAVRGKNPKPRPFYDCPSRRTARTDACVRCRPDELHVLLNDLLRRTVSIEPVSGDEIARAWDEDQTATRAALRDARAALARLAEEQQGIATRYGTAPPAMARLLEGRAEVLVTELDTTRARIGELEVSLSEAALDVDRLASAAAALCGDLAATFDALGLVENTRSCGSSIRAECRSGDRPLGSEFEHLQQPAFSGC